MLVRRRCFRLGLWAVRESDSSEVASEAHGFDSRRGHDDHRAALLDGFIEHVHGAQMESHRVVLVGGCGQRELLRDFGFGLAEGIAGLAFALGLCLAGHGVLERLRF